MEFHVIPNYTGELHLPNTQTKRNNWHSSCCCQPGTTLPTVAQSESRRRSETQQLVPVGHEIGNGNFGMFRLAGLDELAEASWQPGRLREPGERLWRTPLEILKLYAPPGALKWRKIWQPAQY